jgi:flagellar motor switch protein FliM
MEPSFADRVPAMNSQILSQDEVDALLQGLGTETSAPEADAAEDRSGVRACDLAHRERIVQRRMPALDVVHERFARNIRVGLFDLIRRSPEVSIGATKVQKYSAFLREVVVPASFNLVAVKPLRGNGLIVCDPALVFAVIDVLFGDCIAAEYRKAWSSLYPIELQYQRSEMHPQFVPIAGPDETVVATAFTLEIGETAGTVHLCIPYSTFEPIRDLLARAAHGEAAEPDRRWLDLLGHQVQAAEVPLVAELAHAQTTIEQLLALKPGDFVELDLDPVIRAKVDGVPVFDCHYGTSNGKYAIKIDRMLTGAGTGWPGEPNG